MSDALLTPSKITAWLDCSWYLTLKNGDHEAELNHPGPLAKLLMEKGLAHEDACLAEFEAQGRTVYPTPEREKGESFDRWVARVGNPMEDGWDVIYQFPMIHDGMRGVADFLVRTASPLDGYSDYEPYDAKLARTQAKPGHVLQLCFYADALEALTGRSPRQIHLWLGSGEVESLVVEQFGPYWRRLRHTLADVMAGPDDVGAGPEPCAHCQFCEFSQHCESIWRSEDSLVYVAGIRKAEQRALEAIDVATVAELAQMADPVPGVLPVRQERLREQAQLQVLSRDSPDEPPAYRPIPLGDDPVWGHGYGELPEPDPGDAFFDLEGHPFWTAAAGLFFLFGLWYSVGGEWVYEARWAHDLDEQASVAAGVVDFFADRRVEHPGFHVYHYNHTERSALAAMTLGTPSEALFTLLSDTGLFVDLMTVAKNSFQVGVESYGLKSLEALAGFQRHGDIEKGVGAVVDYEEFMKKGDHALLDAIAQYNEDDVRATQALLDWLLAHRPAESDWRIAILDEYEVDPELDLLAERLLAFDKGTAEHLLGDLLGYWRRERLADVGPKFAQLEGDTHLLLDDPDIVAGLEFTEFEDHQGARGDLKYALFSWPEQPIGDDIREGTVLIAGGLGESGFAGLVGIDRDAHTVTLRWNEKREEDGFFPRAITRDNWIQPKPKPSVLGQLARQVLGEPGEDRPNPVSIALLDGAPPRFLPHSGPTGGEFTDKLDDILRWVNDLDSSDVAIQGPPGTGKTYRGAHIIHALITSGKRVGVSAMGHAAIDNLLKAVHDVFVEKGELDRLVACKKVTKKGAPDELDGVTYTTGNKTAANLKYNLVAGTSWFFSSHEMRSAPVDVLLIDEAGQLSLADAVAASSSAKNVLLLGDPLQLAQVSKGTHPDGSGASVLEHALGDDATIPPERGVFLAESWRMHPAVCRFVSTQFYEGRLSSHEACSHQSIDGVDAGLVWLRAIHAGRSTDSPEEAELVGTTIMELLGREWRDRHGKTRTLTAQDFMVEAPYNDQVHLVREVVERDDRTAGVQVGTVDKFQGREAPVVFFTMTTSTGEDMPRGPKFLFSRNRLNVAVSRAQCVAYLVCTEELLDSRAKTVEDMRLIGTLSAFVEQGRPG